MIRTCLGRSFSFLALWVVIAIFPLEPVFADEGVLEKYVIGHGGDQTQPNGLYAFIRDNLFGNGTAQAHVVLDNETDFNSLHLRVWRRVEEGQIVFALLVFRVEIRAYDVQDNLVYSQELAGFTFGDSRSGNWRRSFRIPRDASLIRVTFFGNYE
jgi:hypothetical protein